MDKYFVDSKIADCMENLEQTIKNRELEISEIASKNPNHFSTDSLVTDGLLNFPDQTNIQMGRHLQKAQEYQNLAE